MAETTHRTKGKKARLGLALASLALLPWGAAAFVLGTGTQAAQASPQEKYQDHDVFLHVEQNGESFFVRIDMFVAANGFGAIDQSGLEAAKAEIISRFPGAVELEESAVAAQYVTSGFKWTSNSTSWGYNGTGAPSTVAGSALSAVSSSASTWGSGSNFHFSGGGASGAGTGACGGGTDGQNTVGWANQTGSVLAVTCSWYNGGSPFGAASEFDMQIDPEWTWSTGGAVNIDLQSVVTHEFGHALGLNHSGDGSAVMYPSYSAGSTKRSLAPDDLAGLVAIYGAVGGGATNTPTSTPTTPAGTAINTPTATPTGTPTPVPSTATPTATGVPPTATPTATGVPPTATPTATATGVPPTATPTATGVPPTATPTAAGVSPTATPTTAGVSPTATPTIGGPSATATPAGSAATATPTGTPGTTPESGAPATAPPALPIVPGANLMAWPGADQASAKALGRHGASLRIVYEWDPATGEWKRYGPGLPSFINNLLTMRTGQAYWFIANAALQIPF
ncbi:MAG: matrixin family metalloprotease [Anaerolineaceae bacterium]